METELASIFGDLNLKKASTQTLTLTHQQSSENQNGYEEAKQMLLKFFASNRLEHQSILVDKLRLLEKENTMLNEEIEASKMFQQRRELDI